jgi:excisionase family DNA binding protein
VSVVVNVLVNGARVPVELDDDALAAIAAAIAMNDDPESASPYMTILEAAEYLRCSRQRVYDLLSARRLSRFKDGARTLVNRAEVDEYLYGNPQRCR